MTLVLLIQKNPIINAWDEVEKEFARTFPSLDYLKGFCDGYCFDRHTLLSISEFQKRINAYNNNILETYHVIFIEYNDNEGEY